MVPTDDKSLAPYATNWATRIETGYATFGLSAEQAAAYMAVYTPWNTAYQTMVAARESGIRAKDQTSAKDAAKYALLLVLRELYAFVQASRTVSDANKDLLGVKIRSKHGSPTPPPGAVTGFYAKLNGNGSLTIGWKSANPRGTQGTIYQVWRKIGNGDFEYVGGTGSKHFVDTSIPPGTTSVTYQIQAVRSTAVGPWSQFNVNFCVAGGSPTVSEGRSGRAAA